MSAQDATSTPHRGNLISMRALMTFLNRDGWQISFLAEDGQTTIGRKFTAQSTANIVKMIEKLHGNSDAAYSVAADANSPNSAKSGTYFSIEEVIAALDEELTEEARIRVLEITGKNQQPLTLNEGDFSL